MILAHVITRHMRQVVGSYVQRRELAGMITAGVQKQELLQDHVSVENRAI